MYAQCPECLAIYRIGAAMLAPAHGRVRCSGCAAEFDALATLADELPPEPVRQLAQHRAAPPPLLAVPALRPSVQQRELFVGFDTGDLPRVTPSRGDPTLRADRSDRASAPSFVRKPRARAKQPGGLGWHLGTLLLSLSLAAQWAWLERERVLSEPEVVRVLERVCAQLGCRIPAVRAEQRIALLARDVRPHPTVAGGLVISATLANQAPFPQPYPVVAITLADPNERKIAMRRFDPDEYIVDGAALARGLAPGATAAISFEVEDPGKNAVAFEFEFL